MSVVFQGNGTTTSSIAIVTKTLRDTAPASLFLRGQPNLVEVASDAGISYVYKRGIEIEFLPIQWRNAGYLEVARDLLEHWGQVDGGKHWFWLQPSHLVAKGTVTAQSGGTGVMSFDTNLATPSNSNPLLEKVWGVWMTATVGANVGKKFRVIFVYGTGSAIQMDRPFDVTTGDTFILGFPVRWASDLPFTRKGNRNDRYDIDLLAKVVLF